MADISLQHLDLTKINQITIRFVDDPSYAGARLEEEALIIHTYIEHIHRASAGGDESGVMPNISPTGTPQSYPDSFLTLWTLHPVGNKKPAYKVFRKISPSTTLLGIMVASVKAWKKTPQWSGGYALHLSTWLNAEGWSDTPQQQKGGFDL